MCPIWIYLLVGAAEAFSSSLDHIFEHSGKRYVTKNINDSSVLFKCLSRLWQCVGMYDTKTEAATWNSDIISFIFYTSEFSTDTRWNGFY